MAPHSATLRTALLAGFVGDALAMPTHWYYNTADIDKEFGLIRSYRKPNAFHPTSILGVASTFGVGRNYGSAKSPGIEIVGDMILKGKRKFWTPNAHYHVNLKAGENTLNLQVNRVLLRSLVQNKGIYNLQGCLQDYVAFMTRENSANDTFAESYHRGFFANLASGKTLLECAAPENHDSASIGAFVQLPLVFLANIQYPLHELEKICLNHMHTTHQSAQLDEYCSVFVRFLHDVYTGEDLRRSAEKAGLELSFDLKKLWANSPDSPTCTEAQLKLDRKVIGGVFSSACYISDSFPSILYLAGKYDHSLEEALVSNANVGGDNCHRGAVLGMIMGLTGKFTIPQKWIDELEDKEAILEEVMAFVKSVNLPQ